MDPMTQFSDLKLIPAIMNSLKDAGYETPTPIQQQAIPLVLEGHDLLGIAQTGQGLAARDGDGSSGGGLGAEHCSRIDRRWPAHF